MEEPPGGAGLFGCGQVVPFTLHLNGDGFGECEAEGGLGRHDNLLLPGVGRSRGPCARTQCGADECAFATTGKSADQSPAPGATADEGGGTFPLALHGAGDRTCLDVVAVFV